MKKTFAVVAALTLTFNFAEAQNTRRGQFNPEMLNRLDRDGDGRISKSEAPGRMGERFGMIDSNGDGFLDQEEQAKLNSMMQRGAAGQSAGKSTGRPQGMAPRAQAGGLMAVIDKDGDGELSDREISQAAAALRKLDRDGDGRVSRSELGGGAAGGAGSKFGGSPGSMFSRFDRDGDGKISRDEAPGKLKERFGEVDQNGDGYLDGDEQRQLMEVMRARGGGQNGAPATGGPRPKSGRPDKTSGRPEF